MIQCNHNVAIFQLHAHSDRLPTVVQLTPGCLSAPLATMSNAVFMRAGGESILSTMGLDTEYRQVLDNIGTIQDVQKCPDRHKTHYRTLFCNGSKPTGWEGSGLDETLFDVNFKAVVTHRG